MKKTTKLLLTLTLVMCTFMMFTVAASAASESDLTFTLNSYDRTYSVSGCNKSATGEVVIPEAYNGLPVTEIDREAFLDCTEITSVVIGNNVTYIDWYAFRNCSKIESVYLGSGLKKFGYSVFNMCSSINSVYVDSIEILNQIDIEDGMTAGICVEGSLFYWAENLYVNGVLVEELHIPADMNVNSEGVFGGYSSITSITVDENNPNFSAENGVLYNKDKTAVICYPAGKVDEEFVLPDSVTTCSNFAFVSNQHLTKLYGQNLRSCMQGSFAGCKNLEAFSYASDGIFVSNSSFYGCEKIKSIKVRSGQTGIYYRCFKGCSSLESVEIPEGATYFDFEAFSGCKSLKSIDFPEIFYRFSSGCFKGCESLEEIVIPETMTDIPYAFIDCPNLSVITIHDRVYRIDDNAFSTCNENIKIISNCNSYATQYATRKGIANEIHHDVSTDWTIDLEPTCTTDGSKSRHCTRCSLVEEVTVIPMLGHVYENHNLIVEQPTVEKEGLMAKFCDVCDGGFVYETIPKLRIYNLEYVNGAWCCIKNGDVAVDYTDLIEYNSDWYYVNCGYVDWNYTGLVQYNGVWYYVENGYLDWNKTTLTYYNGEWYYIENGEVNWYSNTLVQYNGDWYYTYGGGVAWDYTGLVQYNGEWYYVSNGCVDWYYTGLVQHNGVWYYVENGYLDWGKTTLTCYNGVWYYVENGEVNWNSNTLVQYNGDWYYTYGGGVAWEYTGLVQYNGEWYYVSNGCLDWGYSGYVTYNGYDYYIRNGYLDWSLN